MLKIFEKVRAKFGHQKAKQYVILDNYLLLNIDLTLAMNRYGISIEIGYKI